MIAHLVAGGLSPALSSRSCVPATQSSAGARACATATEVVRPSEIMLTMAPETRNVEQALFGTDITPAGPSGASQTAKVANRITVAPTIEADAESPTCASDAGTAPETARPEQVGNLATSRIRYVAGEHRINRAWAPAFPVALHREDFDPALENTRALGLSLPATVLARELFSSCLADGGASWDHAAIAARSKLQATMRLPESRKAWAR